MFEVFGENLRGEENLVFDDKGRAILRPFKYMGILGIVKDIPCFLDEVGYAIFFHSSMEN